MLGTSAQRKIPRSAMPWPSNQAASSGPITAPALSMVRCRPKAKPRLLSSTTPASKASRGEVRRP
jgi:hypothetical protein